ncbi:Stk1 family PASTA domain-containing Ser/Thr kinase [Leifsonia sp. NPDC058248]|uniref:Stk1 family PASTA domain-containing Ser/Thr kinase n=1 Tax=Leifsonia sp. NPDC058248 TaxID=3346402 RepID=UPI0036DB4BB6
MTTSQTDPMIGRLIDGRYQVRSRIARGGMATVYLATDLRLERRVAIKVMHGHLADDSTFKSRFVQEARSAARLAHPNVVNVFDQGQDSDMAYLVMEYLPGITLRDLLKDYGKLTAEQTIDIMEAVLSGLAAAHKAGIVHRDLKPENVLLADDGRIKIGDFGLARAASANTATGQALLGTIAYLSPELVTRGVADARSDIYALGIMMYEMLTGEQPFKGEQPMQIAYQHANDAVPSPSSKNPSVPPELDDLVLWATAKDPDQRPRDAREMLDRLIEAEKAIRGESASMQPTMVLPPAFGIDAGDTQIINPAIRQQVAASTPDSVAVLTSTAKRRRAKGWWLFALVILLAGAAAGTGWYFGAGPGSTVPIPELTGKTPAAAASTLQQLGFESTQAKEYSTTIAAGLVSSTDPKAGDSANRGSTVTIRVSQGPKPIKLPPLAGTTVDQATSAIKSAGAVVGTIGKQFDAKIPANTVISASTADGKDLSGGGNYFEGMKVNLIQSVGPIPNVSGMSVDDAKATLSKVGLLVADGPESYSDTVAKGDVISAQPQSDGPVKPNDTLLLETSKGPEPVPVPDVVGKSWDVAKKTLKDAGFDLKYNALADVAPSAFVVSKISPAAGTEVAKGSPVTVNFAGF